MTRTVGHLFAGIDGFGLGLAAHGDAFRTAWTIEYADFPRSILQQREPDAEHLTDVLEVRNPPKVDVLTGGFPCQDLSLAGKGAGIGGRRSGLWGQYARIVGEVEPELVLIENVPALLHRGFELVVRDLVALGYRVEWDCLPAAAFGAPHLRDRVWVAAHRHDRPLIFGQPAALFPMLPEGAAELVGTDGDDDQAASSWHRWPRAGWVDGDPELVMPLEPLAPLSAVKAGGVRLWPTPVVGGVDKGSGGGVLHHAVHHDPRPRWPTPASMDATSGHTGRAETRGRHSLALHHLANNGVLEDAEDADDAIARLDAQRWPTPEASDGTGGRNDSRALDRAEEEGTSIRSLRRPSGAKAAVSLRTAVEADARGLWPTPAARDHKGPSGEGFLERRAGGPDLPAAVRDAESDLQRWPTPLSSDGNGKGPDFARADRRRKDGGGTGDDLVTAVARGGRRCDVEPDKLLPTPRASDGDARNRGDLIAHAKERPNSHHPGERPEGRDQERRAGALNPVWVEWLMGFPLGWTDPTVANADLVAAPWHLGEPAGVPRVSAGTPIRRDRLTALGNALVPAAPAWLGGRYLAATGPQEP